MLIVTSRRRFGAHNNNDDDRVGGIDVLFDPVISLVTLSHLHMLMCIPIYPERALTHTHTHTQLLVVLCEPQLLHNDPDTGPGPSVADWRSWKVISPLPTYC